MKYEQAYKECKTFFENDGIGELDGVAFNMALNALEKQIPKKVMIYNKFECHCECGAIVKTYCKFCYECGQALDWSDTE